MFEKVSQAAERVATSVSRRAFFGWAGRGALATVGVVGTLLAIPSIAEAKTFHCCCNILGCRRFPRNTPCPEFSSSCKCRAGCA